MARIPDETREAIADELRSGELSVRAIATAHGVSPTSVSTIAKDAGLEPAGRTQTKHATEARQTDLAARRAELATLLMDDAFRLRTRAWEKQVQVVVTQEGVEKVKRQTDAGEFRNFYTSIGIIVDKIGVLTRDDSEGMAAVDAWLRSLGAGQTP